MYPNYPCRNAQSCCNEMVDCMDNCCYLGRPNQSMIECCPPRRRLQDFRVFESRPRAPKCKGLAHSLTEVKQQAKIMAAAAAIAQYQNQSSNSKPNTRNACASKCSSQQQAAKKQSPYQTAHYSPSPSLHQCSNTSNSNPCSLKSEDSYQNSSHSGTGQCIGKKSSKRRSKEKDLKVNKNQSSYSMTIADSGCTSKKCAATALHQKFSQQQNQSQNQKYLKNKQNYQCQDDFGCKKRRMEVISEEQEEVMGSEDDDFNSYSFNCEQGRKIQESCADFLNIVNDSVLDTVQKSVETILKEYFMHTLEKIECLCAQMVRNDCLMSKMYLDIMDKISQSNERNQRQFKCLCQFLIETRNLSEQPECKPKVLSPSSSEIDCVKKCPTKNEHTCPCGCKRVGGPGFSKEAKTKRASNSFSQTGEEKSTPNEASQLKKTGNTPDLMARKSDTKRPTSGYDGEVSNCCLATCTNNSDEGKLCNNPSWNSTGLSASNSNATYNAEISRNVGVVDTVITEEIRYFRNQSRIVPNGLGSTTLQPEVQNRNCCRQPTNQADILTTNTTETLTSHGRAANAACKDLATEYCTETRSKATRSEKRRRSADFPITRVGPTETDTTTLN